MKALLPILIAGLSTILVGCNDAASNHKTETPTSTTTTTTPTVETDQLIRSQIHRSRGASVLSYTQETNFLLSNSLPSTYRVIPDMEIDDEGTDGKNVATRESLGRPQTVCGVGQFNSITERINDCSTKNGATSIWSGTQNGASGEGDWLLVAKTDANQELWYDSRTRMVWSDSINLNGKTTFNWCQASGNDQGPTEAATTDCNALAGGISACANLVMEEVGTQIEWRLPTRNDYLQADLDGLRFVVKSAANSYWTSTLKANVVGRTQAWTYFIDGVLGMGDLSSNLPVRCIGAPRL